MSYSNAPQVMPPVGALSAAAAPVNPGEVIGREVTTAVQAVMAAFQKLRQLPGVDIATFDKGAMMMVEGFKIVASTIPRPSNG